MNKHVARKRFGQNFLHDGHVIDRIVSSIAPSSDDVIIEIGPGQAALTQPLLDSGAQLHAIEIDRDLISDLQDRFGSQSGFHLHNGDALRIDLSEISQGRPFRLVGNLPYNISTPLIFHSLKWADLMQDMHFMLQKEVVDRMAAGPGSKRYGRLTVMCQFRCEVKPLFQVSPESFRPAPKVQSSVVCLVPHATPPVDPGSVECLEKVVQNAFSMRRKTLRNSLRAILSAEQIESVGIDPGHRAEQLSLAQFAALSRCLTYDVGSKS